ncbi:ras family-domain-containing protein [Mycena haematopus]|nr:ras family-domain-containing protein [Mycena haematopus]
MTSTFVPPPQFAINRYKLVVVGDTEKTAYFQLDLGGYIDQHHPTIQDPDLKQCVIDEEVAVLDVMDTQRYEAHGNIRLDDIRQAEGVLLVYSVRSRASFERIRTQYYPEILHMKGAGMNAVPTVLVGNKCDEDREVAEDEGRALAKQFGCKFTETSALRNINVEEAFFGVVREIRRFNEEEATRRRRNSQDEDAGCCRGCVVL